MSEFYTFNSKDIFGQSLLHAINLILPNKSTVVEIGSWYAQTACFIAQNCHNVSTIYTVDPYKPYFNELLNINIDEKELDMAKNIAKHNIRYSGVSNKIKLIEKESLSFVKTIKDKSIDMIFLDSETTKESAMEDMISWYPKLKTGGIFSGHHFSIIKDIVDEFLLTIDYDKKISIHDEVWAFIKQ